ncbi:hypothetical protein [Rhodovibrio salinarum]|nr:hypothetical protein [Rhodovibrio salinarum]
MQDPIEKLQESETFQKLDQKVEWAQVTLFSTVALLVLVALGKNVVA